MKVWLALTGLVCCVGGQYTQSYDRIQTQYRVVEPAQNGGSDNGHVSSGYSPVAPLPTAFPLLVSSTRAVPQSRLSSGVTLPAHAQLEQYDPNPQYSYSYGVHDPNNGDVKGHTETRQGDVVSGSYSVMEADGSMRLVEYTADPVHGFNAVVTNTPINAHVDVAANPQHTNVVYPQRTRPVYLYRQASIYPSNNLHHQQQLSYAPSAQRVSPSNEISYVITYQTPSNSQQYTLEQSSNAFTLQQSSNNPSNPSNIINQNVQYNPPSSSQSNQNQQGSYYHFRMASNNHQSNQNQPHYQHQTANHSSMNNRQQSNQNALGLSSYANQNSMMENQRSSSTTDYIRTHPTVTAYPTVTPAYHH